MPSLSDSLPAEMCIRDRATTFQAIANGGIAAFYGGSIAQDIVDEIRDTNGNITPGLTTLADLAAYRSVKREAVCTTYRKLWVCGMPPPSSGGLAVAQALGVLESFDLSLHKPTALDDNGGRPAVLGVHLVAEAERLAYADRDKYVADTDFVPLPGGSTAAMLDKTYLRGRASQINLTRSMGTAQPGNFGPSALGVHGPSPENGTTQITVVDGEGNVVSMTTTVESGFGSVSYTHLFGDGQPQVVAADGFAGRGTRRGRVVIQHHTGQQALQLAGIDRVGGAHLVDFGYVAARVCQAVDQRAVVGQQQEPGGVFVQPAHRLHAPAPQWRGQQGQHAGVVSGLARTLITGRLVQQHHRTFAAGPVLLLHPQHQTVGLQFFLAVQQHAIAELHQSMADQAVALAPAAEALGKEDLLQAHPGEFRIDAAHRARPVYPRLFPSWQEDRMEQFNKWRVPAALLVSALLAACGSDDPPDTVGENACLQYGTSGAVYDPGTPGANGAPEIATGFASKKVALDVYKRQRAGLVGAHDHSATLCR